MARRLGYRFVDTGMMYRAITCAALDRNVDLDDHAAVARLPSNVSITMEPGAPDAPQAARVVVDGTDVTDRLRSPEVGEAVSLVSRVPEVRDAMVTLQREMAERGSIVMVGRDIGTVVLPDAPLKIYLDASPEERVRRRRQELLAAGRDETLEEVRAELALRDQIDSGRAASPLRPADDAVVIDTDQLTLDDVVERIMEAMPCR